MSVITYCLMPNHYRLLLRQDGERPAGNVPQSMFNSYSKAYNLKYKHSGTLFEGRFRAKPVQSTAHLLHLCRYIHANPVKDGLVVGPADWQWSYYREFIEEETGTCFDAQFGKAQFCNGQAYKQFLYQYIKSCQMPEDVQRLINELEK